MELQEIIMKTVEKVNGHPVDTSGCRAFYTPEEWKERGERYGQGSVLVVVHDGGDLARFFDYNRMNYAAIDALGDALAEAGYFAEQCTSWYSAIYPLQPISFPTAP